MTLASLAGSPWRRRIAAWPATLLLLGAVILPAAAAPYRPESAAIVLERLPVPLDATATELRRLRARAAAHPGEPEAALALAERYFALGRTTQDPRYIGYARAALAPWWADPDAPAAILILRAAVQQNRHAFAAALADLDRALAADSGNPRAWAGRASVLLVQGEPEQALASCARLARHSTGIAGTVCQAAALGRLGQAGAALALLDTTLARSPALAPELELWACTELAELAVLAGEPDGAEQHLRRALRLQPRDAFAATALADLLLDRGRPEAALAVVADDPRHDGKLLRAALALRALGDPAWRGQAAVLAARFAAARERGDGLHRREEARFALELADDPKAALRLAVENWRDQREPADARILLSAAAAAEAPAAAAPVLAWLERTGLTDPRLAAGLRRLQGDAP
jgi:tetratricopeptide (TPR) repeat protein